MFSVHSTRYLRLYVLGAGALVLLGLALFFAVPHTRPQPHTPQPEATSSAPTERAATTAPASRLPLEPHSTTSADTKTATTSTGPLPTIPLKERGTTPPTVLPTSTIMTYPFKHAITTVFWAGEDATEENGFISNSPSAWDEEWARSFGGYDDPDKRCGYRPCTFTPKENPFYVALPYYEYDEDGEFKTNTQQVPWYSKKLLEQGLLLKNRWVEVRYNGKSCFGQWEDVGPYEEDDFAYVFGTALKPKNTQGEKAGLDISPAMRDCLDMNGLATAQWRFVEADEVPSGPWKENITTSRPSFLEQKL